MNKEEVLKELNLQLSKVLREHKNDVSKNTYWRGVKIGLETSIEIIKKLN